MDILVVDDELPARDRLRRLIGDVPGWDVAGVCGSGDKALELVETLNPAVVLLDIRMPGMTGIEVARHMALLPAPPAIIFVSAYDEYAIEAFDAQAVGYLLKPVRRDKLERALQQASRLTAAQLFDVTLTDTVLPRRQNIAVRFRDELRLIPLRGIRFFRADQKYVTVSHSEGEHLIDESLKLLAEEFAVEFVRIHRAYLVAVGAIEAIERDADGKHLVRLYDSGETLPVSRRRLAALKQAFEGRTT
ncbi:MAG: response regulator transcription factor [Halioglobus sp.]|nr:response regulator transcription factor [Halioglobus sp.]